MSNNDPDSITYVDDRFVYRLYRNTDLPGAPIETEAVIEFENEDLERPNQYGDFASDAFVFDQVVIIRMIDLNFEFFVTPLVSLAAV